MNYSIFETINSWSSSFIIDIIILNSIVSGILVITSKNPIVSILYLISLFVNVAVYLITKGLIFMGLLYILIYVGAITILFLFIIMLMNIKISELYAINRGEDIPLGLLITIVFLYALIYNIPNNLTFEIANNSFTPSNPFNIGWLTSLFYAINEVLSIFNINKNNIQSDLSQYLESNNNIYFNDSILTTNISQFAVDKLNYISNWDNNLLDVTEIISIGNIFYTYYGILLIVLGIVLLLAMVCAIIICMIPKTHKS